MDTTPEYRVLSRFPNHPTAELREWRSWTTTVQLDYATEEARRLARERRKAEVRIVTRDVTAWRDLD